MPSGHYIRTKAKMSKEQRKVLNAARAKKLYAASEEYRRQQKNNKLKKAYGITLEQYEAWSATNNNLCNICNKPEYIKDKKTNKIRMLAVDHDKKTGLVRGLLCSVCNRGIGMLQHDPLILTEAIDYITYFNNVTVPGVQKAIKPKVEK